MYKSEFPEPCVGFFEQQDSLINPTAELDNNSVHTSVNYHDELSENGIVVTKQDKVMHPLKQTPDSATAYQATNLHFIIRNGMNLPTSKAFVDCSNKTDVIQRTKRSLTGMLRASTSRAALSTDQPADSQSIISVK